MSAHGFSGQIDRRREPGSNLIVRIRDCYFNRVGASHIVSLTANKGYRAFKVITDAGSRAHRLTQAQRTDIPLRDGDLH